MAAIRPMSDDEFAALNNTTADRVGVGTSVTCGCGLTVLGPIKGWAQASAKVKCEACGEVIEAVTA